MSDKPTCETCVYCHYDRESGNAKHGHCKRYPRMIQTQNSTVKLDEDWCGEWSAPILGNGYSFLRTFVDERFAEIAEHNPKQAFP